MRGEEEKLFIIMLLTNTYSHTVDYDFELVKTDQQTHWETGSCARTSLEVLPLSRHLNCVCKIYQQSSSLKPR